MYSFYSPLLPSDLYSAYGSYAENTDPFSGYSRGVSLTSNNSLNHLFQAVDSFSHLQPIGQDDHYITNFTNSLDDLVLPLTDFSFTGYNIGSQNINSDALYLSSSLGKSNHSAANQILGEMSGLFRSGGSSGLNGLNAGIAYETGVRTSAFDHGSRLGRGFLG